MRRSDVRKDPGRRAAIASGSRWTVTQFSNQPPATLPIHRRTPVSAAKKTVPLSSGLRVSNVCAASSGSRNAWPDASLQSPSKSAAPAPTATTLATAAASCELVRRPKNVATLSSRSSPSCVEMIFARAAAVIAGCFVARMRPNAWRSRKLTA